MRHLLQMGTCSPNDPVYAFALLVPDPQADSSPKNQKGSALATENCSGIACCIRQGILSDGVLVFAAGMCTALHLVGSSHKTDRDVS